MLVPAYAWPDSMETDTWLRWQTGNKAACRRSPGW